jgi:hypothetical protein
MRITGVVLILLCVNRICLSQLNPGAAQISLSNSDAALSSDVFSYFNNPSGAAQMNWREAGFYYSPSPFGFSELSNAFAAYNEPLPFGAIGAGVMTYGFNLYKETKFLLGLSFNHQNTLFAGAVVNYHNVSIKNYGSDNAFYLNIGGLAYLENDIRIGFYIHNINRASFGNSDDQIPVIINAGLSVNADENISLNISVDKDLIYKPSLRFGVNYELVEYITLRTGYSSEPSKYSAGVGINFLIFSLDYAVFTHSDLGLTHQAGLIISFGKSGSRSLAIRKHLKKE